MKDYPLPNWLTLCERGGQFYISEEAEPKDTVYVGDLNDFYEFVEALNKLAEEM